jgi:hypothetical protein
MLFNKKNYHSFFYKVNHININIFKGIDFNIKKLEKIIFYYIILSIIKTC